MQTATHTNTNIPDGLSGAELVAWIVDNPELCGFRWTDDNVSSGGNTWRVPLVEHVDVELIISTFGADSVKSSMDGTSRHVTNQRIGRDAKLDNATVTRRAIQIAIVENWLGIKSRRRTVVETPVLRFNGVTYANAAERDAAAMRKYLADGYAPEIATALVAVLS